MDEFSDPTAMGANRLRRRSFYEDMETDLGHTETTAFVEEDPFILSSHTPIILHNTDTPPPTATTNNISATTSYPMSAWLHAFMAKLWYLHRWMAVAWQSLRLHAYRLHRPTKRPTVDMDIGVGATPLAAPFVTSSTTETLVVKQWAYPTHWIKLACGSLVLLQFVLYTRFQVESLRLHVDECIFRERMLTAMPVADHMLTMGMAGDHGGAQADGGGQGHGHGMESTATSPFNGAARRFLARRFEQQSVLSQALQRSAPPQRPWTCMAIVPSAHVAINDDQDEAHRPAHELAFLLPRSQVLTFDALAQTATRLQLALYDATLMTAASSSTSLEPIVRATHGGVLAALVPLSTFRESLFPGGFPDVMLVKSEFALQKLVHFRHTQQQEDESGHGQAGTARKVSAPNGNGIDLEPQAQEQQQQQQREYAISKAEFAVLLLKTSVPDIYNRRLRKNWDAFLHVVVVSKTDTRTQYTTELLSLWSRHPSWPMLSVRFAYAQSLALCHSFVVQLQAQASALHGAHESMPPLPTNVDISCEPQHNTRDEIVTLKNSVGMHLFPVPPELEQYEELVLESASAGAVIVTYNTPIMQEWVPDDTGVRVGSYKMETHSAEEQGMDGALALPLVRVTEREIERAVEELLHLDRVYRVAAGRAARVRYLELRTYHLSALAALDAAVCEIDSEDAEAVTPHSRSTVDMDMLRAFLY